jgi:hypothetical protein
MRNRSWTIAAILLIAASFASSETLARGSSPAQLARAGWTCINAGPDDFVHCFPPGAFKSDETLAVRVFETTDVDAEDAHFLGTELLIRDDVYQGQPCPQNGEEYELLPASVTGLQADYRACHHYSTSH